MRRKQLGILISGRGSNMQALLEAAQAEDCPYEPVIVISNRLGAGGLARAAAHHVRVSAIDHRVFGKDR